MIKWIEAPGVLFIPTRNITTGLAYCPWPKFCTLTITNCKIEWYSQNPNINIVELSAI